MPIEDPHELLGRLKLGREEFCQRLLTMLIVDGGYPRWNSASRPSESGLRFLFKLEELSFGDALPWRDPVHGRQPAAAPLARHPAGRDPAAWGLSRQFSGLVAGG